MNKIRFAIAIGMVIAASLLGQAGQVASAQVATDFYGQATLLSPGTTQQPQGDVKGPHGTAAFYKTSAGGSRVSIELAGLTPGSAYTVQVRAAGCDGGVLYTLSSAPAQPDGTSITNANIPNMVETNSDHVSVLQGDPAADNILLCGKIATIMTLGGSAQPPPGMPASGHEDDTLAPVILLSSGLLVLALGALTRTRLSR